MCFPYGKTTCHGGLRPPWNPPHECRADGSPHAAADRAAPPPGDALATRRRAGRAASAGVGGAAGGAGTTCGSAPSASGCGWPRRGGWPAAEFREVSRLAVNVNQIARCLASGPPASERHAGRGRAAAGIAPAAAPAGDRTECDLQTPSERGELPRARSHTAWTKRVTATGTARPTARTNRRPASDPAWRGPRR